MSSRRPRGGSSSVAVGLVVALVVLGLAIHLLSGRGPSYGASSGGSSGSGSGGSSARATSGTAAGTCPISGLPAQVEQTVAEIHAAGPFPYRQDGVTFDNREHLLPREPLGYYREYTVTTPGSADRGTRRVIAGGGTRSHPSTLYYTGDHYASFCLLTGAG